MWRAKGWAIRDLYADVLMGMWSVEEAKDMQPIQDAEYVDISNTHNEVKEEVEPEKTEPVEETETEQGTTEGGMFDDGGLN